MLRSQEQVMSENVDDIQNRIEFLARLSAIPSVNIALNYALETYEKTKEKNVVFKYTLGTAEKSITAVAKTAEPVVNKFETPIKMVDGIACKGLNKLEEKLPFIKNTPQEMVENSKAFYNGKVEEGYERYNNAKNATTEKIMNAANVILDSSYGKFALNKVDKTLNYTDECVDYYLPDQSEESEVVDETAKNPAQKMVNISSKVYNRLYKKAYFQANHVQKGIRNSFAQLSVAFTLIEELKKSSNGKMMDTYNKIQNQIQDLWKEVNVQDESLLSDKKSMNEKLLYITRKLTQNLIKSFDVAVSVSQSVPEVLHETINQSQNYASDMYSYFIRIPKVEEVNAKVIETFKPYMSYILQCAFELAKYPVMNQALQFLNKNKVEEIQMEPVETNDEPENVVKINDEPENVVEINDEPENVVEIHDVPENVVEINPQVNEVDTSNQLEVPDDSALNN